jgi:hypothetical protein
MNMCLLRDCICYMFLVNAYFHTQDKFQTNSAVHDISARNKYYLE